MIRKGSVRYRRVELDWIRVRRFICSIPCPDWGGGVFKMPKEFLHE
jgi:hypothetical protein